MDKSLTTIEFDKVLEILSGYAVSPLGRERCLCALPLDSIDKIKLAQKAYYTGSKCIQTIKQ